MKKENRMRSLAVLLAAVMTLGGCAGSADTAGTEETAAADTALAGNRQPGSFQHFYRDGKSPGTGQYHTACFRRGGGGQF